jgi:hypothetical protein
MKISPTYPSPPKKEKKKSSSLHPKNVVSHHLDLKIFKKHFLWVFQDRVLRTICPRLALNHYPPISDS